jgi:hypothetical protein
MNAATPSAVVPAKAGTHNHRCFNLSIGGYGSRLALALLAWPGRQRSVSREKQETA